MKCNFKTTYTDRLPSMTRRRMAMGILLAFFVNTVLGPVSPAFAQAALPLPTSMVTLSPGYAPTLIKGMRVYPENPLRFDFIVDPGDSGLQGQDFEEESSKLMKYFLSSLTVPEKDLWVNLSPYEKDRIIPDAFGKTEMGRDMLGQDYILKQLSASLIYPESELGKSFWAMAYQKAYEAFGSTDVPVNTFNKIWIVPEKAVVFAKNNIAYVVETHLKVMLEEDYVALANQGASAQSFAPAKDVAPQSKDTNAVGSQVIRKVILPAIEKEVNEGQNFAPLRQVYNSLILATWFKRNLKESILGKVYVGQNKIDGVTFSDETNKEKIYADYVEAFKKGVYNYIKEEEDRFTNEMVPRKYFSGGIPANMIGQVLAVTANESVVSSSALKGADKAALFAVELGRPQAVAPVDAEKRSSSAVLSLLRNNRASGLKQEVWSGRFSSAGQGVLTMPEVTIETVNQFKQAIAANAQSRDPLSALKDLRPLTEYFLAKLIKEKQLGFSERVDLVRRSAALKTELAPVEELEQSVAQAKAQADKLLAEYNQDKTAEKQKAFASAEMAYSYTQDLLVELSLRINARQLRRTLAQITPQVQRANFVSKMPFFLNGTVLSDADVKELLATTVALVNDLPSSELAQLLQLAKLRAQTTMSFLSKVKQSALNMDGLQVSFVLNAPEVFAVRTSSAGEKILEIDLMSFMKKPNKAQITAWRYDFLNILDPQGRVNAIKRFAVTMQSDFINKNADAVKEILRVLVFMKNVVDPYFGVGPVPVDGTEEEVAAARQSFFTDLSVDGHYAQLIPLLRELGEKTNTYPGKNGKDQKIPMMSERVEAVLRHILNNANLKAAANIQGDYQSTDIILLTELYLDTGNAQWFSGSFIDNQKGPDLFSEDLLPEQDPEVAVILGADFETVFPQNTPDALPGWAQETLDSAPGDLYDDSNPPGWEDETLGDVALQWVARQFRSIADAVSARVNIKQWAVSGAIAVMGLFTMGNIGQGDVQRAINEDFAKAGQLAVTQQIESDDAWKKSLPQIKPGDTGRIIELMKNLKELKRLQEAVQTETGTTIEPAEQAAQLDNAVQPAAEYTVKLYDTLGDIAIKFGKNSVSGALEIAAANPNTIKNMHLIYPDQRITIPGTTTVTLTLGADDTSMKKVIEKIYGTATSANLKKFLEENPGVKANSDLRPGAAVTAILPVEQARKFNQNQAAPADRKVSTAVPIGTDNVGGINLDPSGLEIRTEGDHFKFDVPVDPAILQDLQREPVNGLVPVILNVVPIFNLPQFLGVQKPAETKDSLAFAR